MVWFSRLPQKLPSATNLISTFDKETWLLIGCSLALVSFTLILTSYIGTEYGVKSTDISNNIFIPLGTVNNNQKAIIKINIKEKTRKCACRYS